MSIAPRHIARLALRSLVVYSLLVAPLIAVGIGQSQDVKVAKHGAGLVLFVGPQRQSLS